MRLAVTLARPHGGKTFVVVAGPDQPPSAHIAEFKKVGAARTNPDFAEVQVWTSSRGLAKRRRFDPPSPEAPPENAKAPRKRPSSP